jgi:hypothetical protein
MLPVVEVDGGPCPLSMRNAYVERRKIATTMAPFVRAKVSRATFLQYCIMAFACIGGKAWILWLPHKRSENALFMVYKGLAFTAGAVSISAAKQGRARTSHPKERNQSLDY